MLTCHFETWWNKMSSEWMLEGKQKWGRACSAERNFPLGIAFVFMRRALDTGRSVWHWTLVSGGRTLANSWHLSPSSVSSWLVDPPSSMGGTGWWSCKEGWPISGMSSLAGAHHGTSSLVKHGVPACHPLSASLLSLSPPRFPFIGWWWRWRWRVRRYR